VEWTKQKKSSNDEWHVFGFGSWSFLSRPKGVVNGKGINGHRQMFRMDLAKTLSTRVVSAGIMKNEHTVCSGIY